MIAIVDYKAGNLRSVFNAFETIGQKPFITADPDDLKKASAIVLPGVGAFGDGIQALRRMNFIDVLNEEVLIKKKPFLGICLGMQFLATESQEIGHHPGLDWIKGEVQLIKPYDSIYRIPHIGWNNVQVNKRDPLFNGLDEEPVFYFVHSYHFLPSVDSVEVISATCWHGTTVIAGIQLNNIFGIQFHPEKSQKDGLRLLENFIRSS